nr:hypothetical protein [Tanacetum cinerariifolium]
QRDGAAPGRAAPLPQCRVGRHRRGEALPPGAQRPPHPGHRCVGFL